MILTLGDRPLTLKDVRAALSGPIKIELTAKARAAVIRSAGTVGELIRKGVVRRSQIGVEAQTAPLHQVLRRFHELKQETGVLVLGVEGGSPASVVSSCSSAGSA